MDLDLDGRVAVVTGASRGIGRATALALAAEGARVALVARNEAEAQAVAREIESTSGTPGLVVARDLSDEASPGLVIDAVIRKWGKVDIVVNNAGGALPIRLEQGNDESIWKAAFDLQFHAVRRLSYHAIPDMRRQGWGRIVNVTGSMEPEGVNGSNIAKAAVHQWAKGLSIQVAKFGITVNCLSPGRIETAQTNERRRHLSDEERQREDDTIPIGRFGTPQDMANAIAFLTSTSAKYITGEVIHIDGGRRKHAF